MELNKNGSADAETNKKANTPVTLGDRIKAILNFFTVEPFLLCYILPSVISAVAVQKLNMEKACRVDLGYNETICTNAIAGNAEDNVTIEALNGAQILVADMYAWKQPLQSGIPAAAILFVGAWSDRTGNRKSLMMIPILGELISALGLMLTTYFFLEWPLWVTGVIEALPPAFMGGLSIALMGSYSFIADVTSVDSRTFRIGVVAVIVTLGIPIGTAISGVLTDAVGYYGIFGIGIALYIIGFIHTYFRIHDIKSVETTGTWTEKLIKFFHPRNAWDTLSLLFKAKGKKCLQIILVISAHLLIMGPVYGEGALLFLYTLKKFSMDVVEFSLFSTYTVIMGLLGTIVAVTVFSKWLKMHDSLLGIIATFCKVASSFVYALAPDRSWLYVAPAVDFFGNSGTTAIRSLGTKVVEPDEVGKMCSIVGLADAIIPVVAVPLYTQVYSATLEGFTGSFYLLGAAMTAPAFFVFIALYVLYKKQQRDIVRNPEDKAQYAHDNDVTAL